jgi:hypothetical protein
MFDSLIQHTEREEAERVARFKYERDRRQEMATAVGGNGHFNLDTHNGMITVHNRKTGNHRVFRVRTQPASSSFCPGKRLVQVRDSEAVRGWQSFGFVEEDGRIRVWKRFTGTDREMYAKMLMHPEHFAAKGAEYMFEGTCRVCNKTLTTPESIKSGIGPVCAERRGRRN